MDYLIYILIAYTVVYIGLIISVSIAANNAGTPVSILPFIVLLFWPIWLGYYFFDWIRMKVKRRG